MAFSTKTPIYNFFLYFIVLALSSVASAYVVFLFLPKHNVPIVVLGHIIALGIGFFVMIKFKRYCKIKKKII